MDKTKFPQVTTRPATREDIPYLQKRLSETPRNEQVNLEQCIVGVVEYGGRPVGFTAARLIWQIEPVMLFPEFIETAPHFARQRATFMLIRWIERWLADRSKNTTPIGSYFCFITNRVMQKLAVSFGMLRIYTGGKFFGKDLWVDHQNK